MCEIIYVKVALCSMKTVITSNYYSTKPYFVDLIQKSIVFSQFSNLLLHIITTFFYNAKTWKDVVDDGTT
jgi:hypothetical protein